MKKIRILVIEDNRMLRDGITAMIDTQADLKVVASIDTKENLETLIPEKKPDIILVDLGLQGKNSIELVTSTKSSYPKIRIIVMDLLPLHEDILDFVKAGASGFILKDASVNQFLETIRLVYQGQKVLPSNMAESLFAQIVHEAVNGPKQKGIMRAVRMTKRERQVIELVSEGLTNKEIGYQLHLSPFTVKSHIHNILEKLAIHNRIEIATYAHTYKNINEIGAGISLMQDDENPI